MEESPARRICSLLPSATEIVYALGIEDRLVAVTHECDYPAEATKKPHLTWSAIDSNGMSAAAIDQAVRESLADQSTIYGLDRDLLAGLAPDLMLTQELCDVCAVGSPLVKEAVGSLPVQPRVVSLEPRTVAEILESIRMVARLCGVEERGQCVVDQLWERVGSVRRAVANPPPRRVLTLEWIDPVFVGGHWVPEQVQIAGGVDVLGCAGQPSREARWDEIASAAPEVIIAMPCGFGLERSVQELAGAHLPPVWYDLPAVRSGEVYAVDGSSYFNRPGPRVVDGIEILATILHPDAVRGLFENPRDEDVGSEQQVRRIGYM